ncbi:hypothetical protein OC835_008055, partial [Tilletia horrida]
SWATASDGVRSGQVLFFTLHHLVVDFVSWRVLLEDLEGLLAGKETKIAAPRSMPFKKWVEAMQSHAAEIDWASAWDDVVGLPSQEALLQVPAIFTAASEEPVVQGTISKDELDAESTKVLFGSALEDIDAEPLDFMAAAVLLALSKRAQQDKIVIGIETHGRHAWDDGLDISRTQGWFTSIFPIMAKVDGSKSGLRSLETVVDARRKTKLSGIEFGLLQRFAENAATSQLFDVPVVVNFHGRFQQFSNDAFFQPPTISKTTWDNTASSIGSAKRISIELSLSDTALAVTVLGPQNLAWTASQDSLKSLASDVTASLRSVIDAAEDAKHTFFPGSRLTLFDWLNDEGLNRLTSKVLPEVQLTTSAVKDVAPASPLQRGLIAETLQSSDGAAYVTWQITRFPASVDAERLRDAVVQIVKETPIFRTRFAFDA